MAVIAGWLIGSAVNIGIVQLGHAMMPLEGIDPNNMEALGKALETAGNEHFIFPFLAHALGILVGAIVV